MSTQDQPYDWATDAGSGFSEPETTKISEEMNPYRRGSLVGSAFIPRLVAVPLPPHKFAELEPKHFTS